MVARTHVIVVIRTLAVLLLHDELVKGAYCGMYAFVCLAEQARGRPVLLVADRLAQISELTRGLVVIKRASAVQMVFRSFAVWSGFELNTDSVLLRWYAAFG